MTTKTTISVQADSLQAIVTEATKELNKLHAGDWTITNVNVWGKQDAASKNDELVTIWSAEVVAEINVDLTA